MGIGIGTGIGPARVNVSKRGLSGSIGASVGPVYASKGLRSVQGAKKFKSSPYANSIIKVMKGIEKDAQAKAEWQWHIEGQELAKAGKNITGYYWGSLVEDFPILFTLYALEDGIALGIGGEVFVINFSDIQAVHSTDTYMQFYAGEWVTIYGYEGWTLDGNFKPSEFANWLDYVINN